MGNEPKTGQQKEQEKMNKNFEIRAKAFSEELQEIQDRYSVQVGAQFISSYNTMMAVPLLLDRKQMKKPKTQEKPKEASPIVLPS